MWPAGTWCQGCFHSTTRDFLAGQDWSVLEYKLGVEAVDSRSKRFGLDLHIQYRRHRTVRYHFGVESSADVEVRRQCMSHMHFVQSHLTSVFSILGYMFCQPHPGLPSSSQTLYSLTVARFQTSRFKAEVPPRTLPRL